MTDISPVHHNSPSVSSHRTLSRTQPRPTMSAAILHSAEHCSEDENIVASLPPSPTTSDPRRGADQPALSQPTGDPTFDPIPTTAMSSNEARVSLPSLEGSGGEPKSRPVTGAQKSVASVPISAAGNAECYSSEDMDRTALEDVQVKAPPSRQRGLSSEYCVFVVSFLSLSHADGRDDRHPCLVGSLSTQRALFPSFLSCQPRR
jgi:hypothetical protein